MAEMYDSESLKIEEPEVIEVNRIFKSPQELLDMSQRVDDILQDMIFGITAQFETWKFIGNTDKTILSLMEDVRDVCRLGRIEQESAQTSLKVVMDLLK